MISLVMAMAVNLSAGLPEQHEPGAIAGRSSDWRYVLPPPGDEFEHAPFRALVLRRAKPDELVEKAAYRGAPAQRRYAQIRFGSPSSTRVTVVVDTLANGEVDLYADADRNLKIDERDRLTPQAVAAAVGARRERVWRLPLDVALVEAEAVNTIRRAIVMRLGASGQTLAYATAGYQGGRVQLGGQTTEHGQKKPARTLAARRVDGDGNGLLADAQDRIWIDLNGDGRFDATAEQFLYNSVLNLDNERYIVLSDPLGSRLAFEPLEGTATLRLEMKPGEDPGAVPPAPAGARAGASPATAAHAPELRATAIGRDGSVFAVSSTEPATVPAGDYRLTDVTISLDDPQGGERWSYVFSRGGILKPPRWYKADKNAVVTIDPIGALRFEIELRDAIARGKPGEDVTLQPALYTGDGLLIVVAYRGNPVSPATQETLGAQITLAGAASKPLATAHSGFS
jgi:hypothetical protein